MRVVAPAKVNNSRVLRLVAQNHPDIAMHMPSIRKANANYLRQQGHPAKVASIALPDAAIDRLKSIYASAAKMNNLGWLDECRRAKGFSHCPLCGAEGPSQLEHYLPQSHYAEHMIFSWNLIPTCGLCNPKRNAYANAPGVQLPLIHPYFDSPMINNGVLSVEFKLPYDAVGFLPKLCVPVGGPLAPQLLERLERQVEKCINLDRFAASLNSTWNIWRGKVAKYADVQQFEDDLKLELRATVGPTGANSWASAFLRGLLADGNARDWLHANPITL